MHLAELVDGYSLVVLGLVEEAHTLIAYLDDQEEFDLEPEEDGWFSPTGQYWRVP